MKTPIRRITIVASGLIVIGILLTAIGFFSGAKLSIMNTDNGLKAVGKEDRIHEEWVLNEYKNLEIDLADSDIEIIPSDEYKLEIERLESNEITQKVENHTLTIKDKKSNSGFTFNVNFSGDSQKTIIKVYIPKDTDFVDVNIASNFGDIKIDGMTTNKLFIHTNDADVSINDITSNRLVIENRFGDITASDVKTNDLAIEINDGDAELKKMDIAENADLINLFGDTMLSDFNSHRTKVESTDGDINIKGKLLGQTNISSSFGDVYLVLANKESELSYDIQNEFGEIIINGIEIVSKASNSVKSEDKIDIKSKDGDVEIILE